MITGAVILSFVAFIALGIPDGLLGVGWPSIRVEFGQPLGAITFLFASGSAGYFFSSVNTGRVVRVLGLGKGLILGALGIAAGTALVALSPWWWGLMPGFMLIGAGGGLLDAGFNVYAAHHFSAVTMNWMHASYGIGATAGPPVMTAFLMRTGSWRPAYGVTALFLVIVAAVLLRNRQLFDTAGSAEHSPVDDRESGTLPAGTVALPRSPSRRRQAFMKWGGVTVFFLYAGTEIATGQLSYTVLTEGRAVDPVRAGFWVSSFWLSLTAGRVLMGPVSHRVGGTPVLRWAFSTACVAALVFAAGFHPLSDGVALAVLGFALAPIFPLMVLHTPDRVGREEAHAVIGYQMAAATTGAVILAGGGGILGDLLGLVTIGYFVFALALGCTVLYVASARNP